MGLFSSHKHSKSEQSRSLGLLGLKVSNRARIAKLTFETQSIIAIIGFGLALTNLVAPYCAIPRDYLSDTPLLRAMGFLVSQHGQLGAIPPPPFLSVSPLESMRSGGAIPPLKKGISAILARYPMKTRQMGSIPPSAILSRRVLRDMGGYLALGH